MTVLTKAEILKVIRRAYGPLRAESVADRLPEQVDLDKAADIDLLFKLGLTPDGLFSALGGEL